MASTITGQTFVNSDVVAGQKFYASNYLALIAQMQALNDELVAECVSLGGTQTVTGAKEFTGIPTLADGALMKTSAAPSTDAMIANKKYVDDGHSVKAWARFSAETGTITVDAGDNITSIVESSGTITVTFTNAFTNANYAILGTASPASTPGLGVIVPTSAASGSFVFTIRDESGAVLVDPLLPSLVSLAFVGTLA